MHTWGTLGLNFSQAGELRMCDFVTERVLIFVCILLFELSSLVLEIHHHHHHHHHHRHHHQPHPPGAERPNVFPWVLRYRAGWFNLYSRC